MADNVTLNAGTGGDTVAADDIGGVKYQRVKVTFGADGAATDASPANPLPVRMSDGSNQATILGDGGSSPKYGAGVSLIATNFVPSTGNSTTAQLNASATFTGTIETIYNQTAVVVLVTSDQAGTLTLNQYIDAGGTRQVASWPFTITAGVPFSRSFSATGNFFNLAFQNTSGSPTTTLNIDTAYGTMQPATNLGNMPVALNEVNGAAIATGAGNASAGTIRAVLASDQATVAVNQSGVTATGSLGALNATQPLSLNGATGFAVDLRGTFVATVTFQGTVDGTNWFTLNVLPAGAAVNQAVVSTATAPGVWVGNANGCQQVRAIATAYTSGSVTVVLRAMQAAGVVSNLPSGATTQTVGGTVTANEGTPYALTTAATTNGANIKATAGSLFEVSVANVTAATINVKFYNKATAPTVGTDVPITTIPVAAGATLVYEFGRLGKRFAAGIGIAVTANAAATDTTAVTAGAQISATYI